ncbi:MAG: hypothetical protein AAGD32_04775 [Planctomycetota bacterium]
MPIYRRHLLPASAVVAVLLFASAAPAEVLYRQTFTNNADGDVNAALADYDVEHFRTLKARDRGGAKVVRPESSKPDGAVGDVNASSPHRDDAKPEAGVVRIGLKSGDRVLMGVPFEPGLDLADATSLTWTMYFGNSNSPQIRAAARRGDRWYVQAEAEGLVGGSAALEVDLLDDEASWIPLALVEGQKLAFDGEAASWSTLSGPLTGLGYFADNDGDVTQTIRTDTWTLNGEGVAVEPLRAARGGVEPVEITHGPLPHERRIGPEDAYTTLGIYGQSPESPDGTRVLYTVLDRSELSEHDDLARGALWISDVDGSNTRKLRDIEFPIRVHNGVFQQWIDNDTVAYSGGHHFAGDVYLVNADTGETEHGPFEGAMLGDNSYDGYVLISVWDDAGNAAPQGLHELDSRTGRVKMLFTTSELATIYNEQWDDGSDDPRGWFIAHPKFSTDGSHIAFTVSTNNMLDRSYTSYGNVKGKQHLFTAVRDGSDLRYWGIDKPMHFDWFDEDKLWGADIGVGQAIKEADASHLMRVWDRDKNLVETVAGVGCHVARSADGRWYAGESWYRSNPVVMRLYRHGEMEAAAVLFESPYPDIVWETHRAHINPAFSHDSKRLYYKRPVGPNLVQAFVVDVDDVAAAGNQAQAGR